MRKIKSGVFGLNTLLDGGFNENSTTVVIGCAGAGKTTMATQFIRRGVETGQDCIFVSLDENKDQIIREAECMGWKGIHDYIDEKKLVFIDASGKDFSRFIREELPEFVAEWEGANTRIAIDPLTPVIWATENRYEQRDLLGFLFKETRKIGTVLCTLEEHGGGGDLSGPETIIPMYLADCVIHLKYKAGEHSATAPQRSIKIVKCRNSRHSHESFPYQIVRGFGVVVMHPTFPKGPQTMIVEQTKKILESQRARLLPHVYHRILAELGQMTDADLLGLEPQQFINFVAEDYSS